MRIFRYILIIILSLFAVSNHAQEKDSSHYTTEEIKVYSNKIETSVYTSPAKIEVLKREFIRSKNGDRLSDILQSAGGVFIKSYGNGSSLQTISMNGLETEQTLILLNGSKLNSYQNAQIDLSLVSKDNIERIEVVNNGYSSIYGSDAIGGVVNIVTSRAQSDFGLNLSTWGGSYGYSKVYLDLNKNLGPVSINAGVSSENSKDNFDYYFHSGKTTTLKNRVNNNYTYKNFYSNIEYTINSKNHLSFYTNFVSDKRSIPGLETGTAPADTKQDDRNWNSILVYKNVLNNTWSLRSESNFQNNLMNYYDEPVINSYYKNIVLASRSQVDYNSSILKVTGGYDFTYATINSNELVSDVNRYQTGMFVVTEYTPVDNFKIFPSVRFDNVSDIDETNVAGKLGINYKPFSKIKLFIRSNIGNNYAAPTFNQLYWGIGGNPNLKTQKSINFDAGAVFNFDFITQNTLDINYTYINFKDKIIWQPGPGGIWSPINIDKTVSNVISFDFKAEKELSRDMNLNIGLNYSHSSSVKDNRVSPDDPTYGKQLIYIPVELSKTNIGLNYKEFGVNLYYRFIGKRYTDYENTIFLPAMDLLDGSLNYTVAIWKVKTRLNFELNNILNTDYQVMPGYPMPLRNFKLGISISY